MYMKKLLNFSQIYFKQRDSYVPDLKKKSNIIKFMSPQCRIDLMQF